MKEYHLPFGQAMNSTTMNDMNSTIVNDATYCRSCTPNMPTLVPYLFELRLLLTLKYTSHTFIVHHPFRIKVCRAMNVTSE